MSSSTKRGFSPSVAMGTDKKPRPNTNNGNGPAPLKYSNEPVDDVNMNELIDGKIDLQVITPGGKTTEITIDSNIPMQDLRVLLAAKNKVSPTGYILTVFSDETGKPLNYKAHQTIGSLEGRTVQLVAKHKEREADRTKYSKTSSKGNLQPFETTHRFTINLPRNQKMVMRISPEMSLEQLYKHVCTEKLLDPRRYAFQHPSSHHAPVDLAGTVASLKVNEVNLVPLSMVADAAKSMPDLSRSESLSLPADSAPSYMPGASEPKKKRGFLSFLKRSKDNKFKVHETRYQDNFETASTASHQMTMAQSRQSTTPPPERRSSDATNTQVRPKSMFVTAKELQLQDEASTHGKENILSKTSTKKKRPAPPPPNIAATIPESVEICVEDTRKRVTADVHEKRSRVKESEAVSKVNADHVTQRLHSRNSSDSSGYHELTLSGAESPEASRGNTNFKHSIDTTSIESAENNGDSGINGHSPVQHARHRDSKTLPLPTTSKQQVQESSHSLDRRQKSSKQPAPSTKKRRAPAPPPVAAASSTPLSHPSQKAHPPQDPTLNTSPPEPTPPVQDTSHLTTSGGIVIEDDLEGDDNESLNISDIHDGFMQMIEDQSIASEDIDFTETRATRPCSFVAPPPPSDPPETADVAVSVHDNSSLGGPSSAKSSPVSAHSRTDSRTSMSSINTIEDIHMAFQQTIAMAEEAIEAERPAETGYKNEMAKFVESMSKLTEQVDKEGDMSDGTSISLPDTESDTGSVIHHDRDGRPYHAKMDSCSSDSGSIQKFDSLERVRGDYTAVGGGKVRRDSLEIHRENKVADNEVSEIDVHVDTLLPPPEFQNRPEPVQQQEEEEEEEEEEYRESTEEIIITMAPSSSYTFRGAYKIPDLETPKEHRPDSPKSRTSEHFTSFGTFEADEKPKRIYASKHKEVKEAMPPREKETFVLTREDLDKIKYVDDNFRRSQIYSVPSVTRPRSVNTDDYEDDSEFDQSNSALDNNVRSRCSELGFRPNSEDEIDNVPEEKSIAMIALPAMRTSVLQKSDDEYLDSIKDDSYKTSTSMVLKSASAEDRQMRNKFFDDFDEDDIDEEVPARNVSEPVVDRSVDEDDEDEDVARQQQALQAQYELLQQQFQVWQAQLQQNQALLATQNMDPEVQNIQQMQVTQMQMQMDMQQQMMSQLQKSMQALSLQQQSKGDHSTTIIPASAAVVAASSQPSGVGQRCAASESRVIPVAPPPPPMVQKQTAVKTEKSKDRFKDDPRFQRKLDPREELMIAIRTFGGRNGLNMESD